jgi:hypothetical protein
MEFTLEEFKKINELEYSINVVECLANILTEYEDKNGYLMEILFEKTALMKTRFDDFISCMIQNT